MLNKDNRIKCPNCGSPEWTFAGWQWRHGKKETHRRRCSECGRVYVLTDEAETSEKEKVNAARTK